MRILHTADWHIGKIVNEFSMLEDQEAYLNQLVEETKKLDVDLLIMAGDLYDRSIPPKEAVVLADRILTRFIQEANIPVLAIAGNHDSNERLEYGSEMLAKSGLYIEGLAKPKVRKAVVKGANFYLLPYADYVVIRKLLDDKDIHNQEDALKAQIRQMMEDFNPDEMNILIMHGYVINQTSDSVEDSDSERPLSIGTAEYVDASLLEMFDYTALGHLHKAQKVKCNKIRYSGSPLKYSKSEVHHKKQSLLVDITKDSLSVESVLIEPKRDVRILKGLFDELMEGESDDYIFFELEDSHYIMDAMNQLRRRYPNAMALEYKQKERREQKLEMETEETMERKELPELFANFFEVYKGKNLSDQQKEAVIKITETIRKEED